MSDDPLLTHVERLRSDPRVKAALVEWSNLLRSGWVHFIPQGITLAEYQALADKRLGR